jgi:rare lipoprotein A
LTAAHHHLPFGSKVRVTHLQNGRSVDVMINDRMRHPQRVIDLSYAAAYRLGMIAQGIAPVRLEILSSPSSSKATVATTSTRKRTSPSSQASAPSPKFTGYTTAPTPYVQVKQALRRQMEPASPFQPSAVMLLPTHKIHEGYEVQFAAYDHAQQANAMQWQLYHQGIATRSDYRGRKKRLYRVLASHVFPTQVEAHFWATELHRRGYVTEAIVIPQGW